MKDIEAWETFEIVHNKFHNFITGIIEFCKDKNVQFPSIFSDYKSITIIWDNLYLCSRLQLHYSNSALITYDYHDLFARMPTTLVVGGIAHSLTFLLDK